MSKKKIYIVVGVVILLITVLVTLKSKGIIGGNDDSKEVETAKVDEITIVETVSATGKIQPEIEVKISSEVSGEIMCCSSSNGRPPPSARSAVWSARRPNCFSTFWQSSRSLVWRWASCAGSPATGYAPMRPGPVSVHASSSFR